MHAFIHFVHGAQFIVGIAFTQYVGNCGRQWDGGVSAIEDSGESAGGQFFCGTYRGGAVQGVIQLAVSGTALREFVNVFDNLDGSSNAAEVL
jgi:hypothetical protein